MQTVTENKSYFSNEEIKGADISRETQEFLFYSGMKTLKTCVTESLLEICAITADDDNRDEITYGPPVTYSQGHMIHSKPPMNDKVEKIPLQPMMPVYHLQESLCINFFVANENTFSTPNLKVLISLLPNTALAGISRLY